MSPVKRQEGGKEKILGVGSGKGKRPLLSLTKVTVGRGTGRKQGTLSPHEIDLSTLYLSQETDGYWSTRCYLFVEGIRNTGPKENFT